MSKDRGFHFKTLLLLMAVSFFMSSALVSAGPTHLRPASSARDGGIRQELVWVIGDGYTPQDVKRLSADAKEYVSAAFSEHRAFVVLGEDDASLRAQIDAFSRASRQRTQRRVLPKAKEALMARLKAAADFLDTTIAEGARAQNGAYEASADRMREATRIVLVYDESEVPTLVGSGMIGTPEYQALISFAGRHRYTGFQGGNTSTTTQEPRSIYLSLSQVEALAKRDDKQTLGAILLRHDLDLLDGSSRTITKEQSARARSVMQSIFQERRDAYLETVEKTHNNKLKSVTATIVSLDVATWLGDIPRIPQSVVDFVTEALNAKVSDGTLKAAVVRARGRDLVIHVNHQSGPQNPVIQHLLTNLMVEALVKAKGEKSEEAYQAARDYVGFRPAEATFVERGSDPDLVFKAIDAGPGFFNMALWSLYVHPDRQSTTTIDASAAPGYRFVLTNVDDLENGVTQPRTLSFDTRNELYQLQMEASNPDEWVITHVYPVVGPGTGGKIPTEEPVAVVSYDVSPNANGERNLKNPVAFIRTQSGAPAVGETTNAFFRPHVSIGGPNGDHYVAAYAVSDEEARSATPLPGMARVVAYGYQSSNDGAIPLNPLTEQPDVYDQLGRSSEAAIIRKTSVKLAKIMLGHGEFDPYLVPKHAERIALAAKEEHMGRFETLPEANDPDPVMAASRQAPLTASIIKIDTGGDLGHQGVPTEYRVITEASLRASRTLEAGSLFNDSHYGWAGDDNQINAIHTYGTDSNEMHGFSLKVFWRQVWAATALGHKWYGRGQDLVGAEIKKGALEDRADLNDAFFEALKLELPENSIIYARLKAAYDAWKTKAATQEPTEKPYSGNVQGMGPGFAELPLEGPARLGKLGMDKLGPSTFNIPFTWAVDEALKRGVYDDLVYEIWDTKEHQRIFVSAKEEKPLAIQLLGAVDRFNIKRIWGRRPNTLWNPANPHDGISAFPIASLSTERLSIISGGEYLGKDDPVALGHGELMDIVFEFMRDEFYFSQGDERGSHKNKPRPEPLDKAIATLRSKAIQTGERFAISADGKYIEREDVYADPSFDVTRERDVEYNELMWTQQGSEWGPIGVGKHEIEPSYPAYVLMNALEADDSENRIPRTLQTEVSLAASEWAGLFPSIGRRASTKAVVQAHRHASDGGKKTIVINTQALVEGPDTLIAIQRYLNELGFANATEAAQHSGVQIYLSVPDQAKDADAYVDALLQEASRVTHGAIALTREHFAGVVSGTSAEQIKAQMTERFNVDVVDAIIGPSSWVNDVRGDLDNEKIIAMALTLSSDATKASSGASAFLATIEILANDGVIEQEFADAIGVIVKSGQPFSVAPISVNTELQTQLSSYRASLSQV